MQVSSGSPQTSSTCEFVWEASIPINTSGSRLRLSTLRVSWRVGQHLINPEMEISVPPLYLCARPLFPHPSPGLLSTLLPQSPECIASLMMEVTSAKISGGRWEDLTWVP